MEIKTIDITAKEWFDKVNGNSYFSARTTVNYGMPDEKTIVSPFQYGYGDHYLTIAAKDLKAAGLIDIDDRTALWRYCEESKIPLRYNKISKCLKREVKDFGVEITVN